MMKLEISCKRKGVPAHGFKIEWKEPEETALKVWQHFYDSIRPLLKAHGLRV